MQYSQIIYIFYILIRISTCKKKESLPVPSKPDKCQGEFNLGEWQMDCLNCLGDLPAKFCSVHTVISLNLVF